jgi:hypothetical protein
MQKTNMITLSNGEKGVVNKVKKKEKCFLSCKGRKVDGWGDSKFSTKKA